jgi:hypothetical protein
LLTPPAALAIVAMLSAAILARICGQQEAHDASRPGAMLGAGVETWPRATPAGSWQ